MALNTLSHTGQPAIVTGQTATGNSQTTALQLAGIGIASFQEVTTTGAGQGVILPVGVPTQMTIKNIGSNDLLVYPQVGGSVDNGTTNLPATVKAGNASTFITSSMTNWDTVGTTSASGSSSPWAAAAAYASGYIQM